MIYHKVTTRITDRHFFIVYSGVVQSDEKPQSTYKTSFRTDVYEDFFLTEEDAMEFINTQKKINK